MNKIVLKEGVLIDDALLLAMRRLTHLRAQHPNPSTAEHTEQEVIEAQAISQGFLEALRSVLLDRGEDPSYTIIEYGVGDLATSVRIDTPLECGRYILIYSAAYWRV